ncbi:hypothetical protein QAD02_010007 [Eretmocerus hayati]|uniref:Uncharacterized protein n=1 Tax=Eretmocerus hayati TaxID=131215 RepID=A0ACC2NDB4_9HYME|nr:hypothetical protein QAD02_010007 [Eretmocerus hayati]
MFKFAVIVLQVLLLSALYTQETRSWRMAEYVREMNTPWNQWGPVSHDNPKMEEPVEIRSEEHCKKSPVKMEEYPFFVIVQINCYDDSQKTIWAGERQYYCVLYSSIDISCRYSESSPGYFCDATAELVADGSIHKVELRRTDKSGYKYYKLSKPIDDSSKAKPTEMVIMVGYSTIPAVLITVMPTVGEKYGLVYTENVTYIRSDSCTGWGAVSPSNSNPCRVWCEFHKSKCLSRYDFIVVLVQGKLAPLSSVHLIVGGSNIDRKRIDTNIVRWFDVNCKVLEDNNAFPHIEFQKKFLQLMVRQ